MAAANSAVAMAACPVAAVLAHQPPAGAAAQDALRSRPRAAAPLLDRVLAAAAAACVSGLPARGGSYACLADSGDSASTRRTTART